MRLYVLSLLSLCLLILSCETEIVPSITTNQSEINVSDAGGSQTISFNSNVSWTARSSANWCTFSSPASGDASIKSVTVVLSVNDTYSARSCNVTIMAGDVSKTFTINQNSNLGLLVTQDKYDLSNEATTIEVEVKANVEFDVTISGDWITRDNTRGLSSSKLHFNIAKNDTYGKRDGSITIKQKNGPLTSTIKVYQSQEDAIILSNKREDLSNEGQTLSVELKTNVDFEVIIPQAAKSWVSYTGTRALRTETLLLNIAANESYDARSTEIYVKNKATSLQDTLTIHQSANLGLIVTKDKYDLTNDATTIEVEVKANVEFDVLIAGDWISRITTRGLTTTKLSFEIAKNKSYDNRNGSITIKQKNGPLTSTIKVYQSQEDAIILSNKTQSLSSDSKTLEVELKTNVDYEVIIPQAAKSWVSYTGTRALRTETLLLNIAANESYDARSTEIYVKNRATSLQDTLTINQSARLGLFVSKDKFELTNNATTIEVDVEANFEFEVTMSDAWITRITTRGLASTKLSFHIAKNNSYDNRAGYITIKQKNGALSKTINVFQSQEDAIILSNKTQSLSNESQTLAVELKTNVDFEVIIPQAAKSWVSYTGTRALRTETLTLNIAANENYDARSTEIYVKNRATSLQDTLTINQSARLGLFVSKDKFELTNNATTIEVDVEANFEFEVTMSEAWITRITTRGLASTKLSFHIAKNSSYDNRAGYITIKQKNGALSKTINVFQSQEDAIILSKKTQSLSNESQTLAVELKTNVDYEVIIPQAAKSWVSYTGTRALRTETLQLNITENKSNEARTTEIYVKNRANSLQDTLTIIQEKAPDLPTLTTLEAFDISKNSAKSGGHLINDGGAPILAKGVCWNTTENPTIENSKTLNGLGDGDFVANISNLDAATKYYVRAYATNKTGTSYGSQVSFTTTSTVATPFITPEGGIYITPQNVAITCATDGAQIRYTLDGSEPIETSALYSGEIPVTEGMTIKARAFKTNWIESSVATETYVIELGVPLILGTSNTIQHIDASQDFTFRLNDLDNKNVFFVFSNKNSSGTTTLPQLQSNVQTMRTAERSSILSEPDFIVSGKPSITDFNNDPFKYPKDGMDKPQYQRYSASQPERYIAGSSEVLYDDNKIPQLSTVRKVISAHGKNLYVWVADNCWGPQSTKSYHVTQQMVDALALKFLNTGTDNDIYEWVTNICGAPWGNTGTSYYIPETDDIHIWLTDIDNDNKTTGPVTLGYYFSRDNFRRSSYQGSNEKLMFTIDAVLFGITTNGTWDVSHKWPMLTISTLAHEFTHMIYFYQNNVLNGLSGNTAINEMSAQCVEDLVSDKILANGPRGVSYTTSTAGSFGNSTGRFPLYNSHNDYNLLQWSSNSAEVLVNYSKTYAFGAYLMRNYGGANFIKELIQNNSTGVNSIVAAVNSNGGGGLSYGDILQRFGAANLLSDKTTMSAGYRMNTGAWSTSTVNGITYNLGSINLFNYSPNPYIYNQLPASQKPGSNIYYRAGSNLSGTKEWHFEGMSTDTKLTVVIK